MLLIVYSLVIHFLFELVEDIQLNGHYWDKSNKVYKYKIESNKEKNSKMQQTDRTDMFKNMKYYNWKSTSAVEDNDFKPLAETNSTKLTRTTRKSSNE